MGSAAAPTKPLQLPFAKAGAGVEAPTHSGKRQKTPGTHTVAAPGGTPRGANRQKRPLVYVDLLLLH